VLLYVADESLRSSIKALEENSNGVDELRYLFITSQVELLDSVQKIDGLKYNSVGENWGIGVVDALGEKCDRCWNYSTHVGESQDDPLLCERCVDALAGEF
jgi:isoleucyl-tRNA synthetase